MKHFTVLLLAFVAFSLLLESFGYKPIPEPVKPRCPRNEEYLTNGRACQTECATLGQKCTIVNIKQPEGCYCKAGFARITPGGLCVPQNQCPKPFCPKNEVWLECGQASACQRWCDRPDIPCYIKTSKCPEGCYCKAGYSRHPETEKCIKTENCPKDVKDE